jgi:putative peptide zinc metalloprotease protein
MLCPGCRRQLSRSAPACGYCGRPRPGAAAPLELVLPDGTRVPVVGDMVLGRASASTLQLADPTVSRTHAHIGAGDGGAPVLEDIGSTAGTFLDDTRVDAPVPLRDGARIRLGTLTIGVERRRAEDEAGRTVVVGAPVSDAVGTAEFGFRPCVNADYALKRLDAAEGGKRFVLRSGGRFLRLSARDVEVLQLLDGQHSLVELIAFAEQRFGPTGSARVARLLADLGDRGFLAGVAGTGEPTEEAPTSRLRRLIGPHVREVPGVPALFERLYERGGWVLFLRPVLVALALLAAVGVGCFGYLVVGRYGTPFVVAERLLLGGLVFLLGRFAFAALHEVAHGLAMASYGRRIDRAGVKAILVFPYVFIDGSAAWFEPRRHRIAISAAGPACDFVLGGLFAVLSTVVDGTLRDVFFQLAFAAYIGALFNLNPVLDRDGYHMLVDALREPGLKRRARAQFERRVAGDKRETDERALSYYTLATTVWAFVGALFAVGMTLHYKALLEFAPAWVVYPVMASVWVALFIPFLITVGKPLLARLRRR